MTAPELKPCPFCGGDLIRPYISQPEVFRHEEGTTCFAGKAIIHPENREKWNRRADLPPTDAQVKELVELLREARSDLAIYVEADWPENLRATYPSCERKYQRDMELCRRIDAAIQEASK